MFPHVVVGVRLQLQQCPTNSEEWAQPGKGDDDASIQMWKLEFCCKQVSFFSWLQQMCLTFWPCANTQWHDMSSNDEILSVIGKEPAPTSNIILTCGGVGGVDVWAGSYSSSSSSCLTLAHRCHRAASCRKITCSPQTAGCYSEEGWHVENIHPVYHYMMVAVVKYWRKIPHCCDSFRVVIKIKTNTIFTPLILANLEETTKTSHLSLSTFSSFLSSV